METYNYSQFNFNNKNRDISKQNVSNLKKSILEVGFIRQRAILVNKYYLIIDGHHRFLALQELKMPIYYEVEKEISLKEMIFLNSCQKNWSLSDFIYLHAKQGKSVYQELVFTSEKYNLTMSNSIQIVINNISMGGITKSIREGVELEIYKNKSELINLIIVARENVGFTIKKDIVSALRILINKADKKEIEKVVNNFSSIREQTSVNNFLITFENIINRKMGVNNKINLLNK